LDTQSRRGASGLAAGFFWQSRPALLADKTVSERRRGKARSAHYPQRRVGALRLLHSSQESLDLKTEAASSRIRAFFGSAAAKNRSKSRPSNLRGFPAGYSLPWHLPQQTDEPVSKTTRAKVVIIGSGPAGYTAAIYAARAMLDPILIQGVQPGGQLTITTDVENYPGFADVIQGPWLMEQMQKQAAHVGTQIVTDHVNKADLARRPFRLECDSGDIYFADTLILATGAQARWLDLPSEQKFRGYGVSACATCDGFFYRGKEVLVIGGGNTAVEEALFLTNFASKVTVVHRRDSFRAERILQERLYQNPKISVLWHTVLQDVVGDENPFKVRAAVLRNVKTNETTERPIDGIFIAIGHSPASELVAGQVEMKHSGYIKTASHSTATSVPGVFAAGDVADDIYRQAVTAAGLGCMAALEAEKFLAAHGEAEPRVAAE